LVTKNLSSKRIPHKVAGITKTYFSVNFSGSLDKKKNAAFSIFSFAFLTRYYIFDLTQKTSCYIVKNIKIL